MSRFVDFLNYGLTWKVGETAATVLTFGIPAIAIGIVTLLVTHDLGAAIAVGFVGGCLVVVGLMGAAEGRRKPR